MASRTVPSPDRPASSAAAALFFLFWQQPTDRALAGWSPFDGVQCMSQARQEYWLEEQLGLTPGEIADYRRQEAA